MSRKKNIGDEPTLKVVRAIDLGIVASPVGSFGIVEIVWGVYNSRLLWHLVVWFDVCLLFVVSSDTVARPSDIELYLYVMSINW